MITPAIVTTHIGFIDDKGVLFEEENVLNIFGRDENIKFSWQEGNSHSEFVPDPDVRTLRAVIDRKVWNCTPNSPARDLTCRLTEDT